MAARKHVAISAILALVASYVSMASPADARTRNWFMTGRSLGGAGLEGGWVLSQMTDSVGGIFSGNVCGVNKDFPTGTKLGFFVSVQAKSAFISISNKDWQSLKIRHGQTSSIVLRLKPDGREINLTANIIGDTSVPELSADISYGNWETISQDLRKSTGLEILADGRPVFSEEMEASSAIGSLESCVSEINSAISKQKSNDPFN